RNSLFFIVAFVWIGLAHPPGTSTRFIPLLAAAYALPLVFYAGATTADVVSMAYAVPICLLIGETVAWVADRLRRSEVAVRSSERRFRSLVHNSADVITVLDENGYIVDESDAVEGVLGLSPDARRGVVAGA